MKGMLAVSFALLSYQPALAQDSASARIVALEAKVARLEAVTGVERFFKPQITCGQEMEAQRPTTWFSNGEYDMMYRSRQFGCAFNILSPMAYGFASRIDGLATRVAAVEESAAAPSPSAPNLVIGDLVVTGRICVPIACKPEVPAHLQIQGPVAAEIFLRSNMNGQDPQGSAAHSTMVSTSPDGGIRLLHNSHHQTGPNWMVWPEADKPRTIFGFDSRGTPSISQDYDGYVYPSQSLVFNFDRQAKIVRIQSMKKGWKVAFCASLYFDNNCGNSHWTVPVPQQ